jgi:hypothetical protein
MRNSNEIQSPEYAMCIVCEKRHGSATSEKLCLESEIVALRSKLTIANREIDRRTEPSRMASQYPMTKGGLVESRFLAGRR